MKKILVDINIILDFLNKRNFYELAKQIIQLKISTRDPICEVQA
jgi:uncharacterized protein YpiB (UPF0302 family)